MSNDSNNSGLTKVEKPETVVLTLKVLVEFDGYLDSYQSVRESVCYYALPFVVSEEFFADSSDAVIEAFKKEGFKFWV